MEIKIDVYEISHEGKILNISHHTLFEQDIIRLFQSELINQGYASLEDNVHYEICINKVICE